MKKQKILILSLAMLTGFIATGCSHFDSPSDDPAPNESVIDDVVETSDEVGKKVALGATVAENKVNMSSSFGYQILDKKESSMSVRIIAVVDGYKDLTSASVTSKVVAPRSEKTTAAEGEETVKEERTFSVEAVYSSLTDDANVSWNGDKPTYTKNYYIIYTLRNVPLAHYFDTIIVKFSATSTETVSQEFIINAQGIEGENKYVNFEKLDGTTDEYYISGTNDSLINNTEIYVSPYHFTVTDNYAVKDGTITTIGARGFNNSSSHVISNLVLPNTITTLKKWAFYRPNVTKVNIPSSVTTVEAEAYYGSSYYALGTLVYEATNLVNDNAASFWAKNIVVDASVESIPNAFFNASNTLTSAKYEGTESEWAALKTEDNKNSGFFALDTWCSDSYNNTVTFHYGEGKLGTTTGDVVIEARNDRTISNPGSPVLSGKEFKGWFLDEGGMIPFDFDEAVTSDLDIYAVYGNPGAGYSLDNPREITPSSAQNFTASLYPGKEYEYIKFSVPTDAGLSADGDWYYFQVDTDSCIKDTSISKTSLSQNIQVYESDKTTKVTAASGHSLSTENVVQKSTSSSGPTRIFAKPGDTYYLKVTMSYNAETYPNYGTLAMKFFTFDCDGTLDAETMTLDTAVTPYFDSTDRRIVYKYVASSTASLVLARNEYDGSQWLSASAYCEDDLSTALGNIKGNKAASMALDVTAGKTYYIEITTNTLSSKIDGTKPDYVISAAPAGYSRNSALDYEIGNSETVTNINSSVGTNGYDAGSFYKFTVTDESALFTLTTGVGSSSYKQKVIIYDASGDTKQTFESSANGTILKKKEITLTAGDYTMFVGYTGGYSGVTWVDYEFNLSKVVAGDSVNLPADITLAYDVDTTLASTTDGRFYRFTADAPNFLTIDTSNAGTGVSVSLLSASGSTLKSAKNGTIVYKTTADTDYIIQISGADADAVLRFSRSDTAETGESAETAYSMSFGSDGLMDMTPYATGNYRTYFKYTATESGTYKMYFQATLAGVAATSGADSDINDVYDSTGSSASALTAVLNTDDDKSAHAETLGTPNSAYAEYVFEAGKTYYLNLKIPAVSATFDTIKFGIAKKTVGSSADVATDLGTLASDASSISATMNASGYWSKFTLSSFDNLKMSIAAIEGGQATVELYSSETSTTSLATLTSGGEGVTKMLAAGTYWIRAVAGEGITDVSSVTIDIVHEELQDNKIISMTGGTGSYSDRTSIPTDAGTSVTGWNEYADAPESDGKVYKSGQKGVSYGKSAMTFTFAKAGTFSFSWACSGEKGYDYIYITHTSGSNTTTIVDGKSKGESPASTYSAMTWTDVTISVAAGDTVTFLYTKDGGSNSGLDAAFVKNAVLK